MTHDPRTFWNERYDRQDYRYGTEPNRWLEQCAKQFEPGARVLSVGDGEGRNGVWLSAQGFDTVTIEPSDHGVAKARRLAEARGVEPDIRQGRFPDDLGEMAPFDAVVLSYVHAASEERTLIHTECVRRLAPGGLIVLEAFAKDQLGRPSGGPQNADLLFSVSLLATDFADLEILTLEQAEVPLDEGDGHVGEGAVIRLLARA